MVEPSHHIVKPMNVMINFVVATHMDLTMYITSVYKVRIDGTGMHDVSIQKYETYGSQLGPCSSSGFASNCSLADPWSPVSARSSSSSGKGGRGLSAAGSGKGCSSSGKGGSSVAGDAGGTVSAGAGHWEPRCCIL